MRLSRLNHSSAREVGRRSMADECDDSGHDVIWVEFVFDRGTALRVLGSLAR